MYSEFAKEPNLSDEEYNRLLNAGKVTKVDYKSPNIKHIIKSKYKMKTKSSRPLNKIG